MPVTVRRAEANDAPALFDLIAALAAFEELEPPSVEALARLRRDGWPDDGSAPRFAAWLAETTDETTATDAAQTQKGLPSINENGPSAIGRAAGYAITFETYSSFLALPTLYLEDIFVRVDARRHGVGSALMRHLIAHALERGCGRVEWVVLDWNVNAQTFYQRIGANHLTEWQTYRLTNAEMPAALARLASRNERA